MAFRKGLKKNTEQGTPLRKSAATAEPTVEQTNLLGTFLAAAVIAGNGVYALRYASSGAIKVTLYVDGDKYEDTLNVAEDWKELFDDFARQLGFHNYWREAASALPRATRPGDAQSDAKTLRVPKLPEADLP